MKKLACLGFTMEDNGLITIEVDSEESIKCLTPGFIETVACSSGMEEFAGVNGLVVNCVAVKYEADTNTVTVNGVVGVNADDFFGMVCEIYEEEISDYDNDEDSEHCDDEDEDEDEE